MKRPRPVLATPTKGPRAPDQLSKGGPDPMSTNLFTQLAQGQNTTDQIIIELVRTDDGMSVSMVIHWPYKIVV